MARDKDTGKFIPEEKSFEKAPFPVKMTTEMKQWVKEKGGGEYIRMLIERDIEAVKSLKQAE